MDFVKGDILHSLIMLTLLGLSKFIKLILHIFFDKKGRNLRKKGKNLLLRPLDMKRETGGGSLGEFLGETLPSNGLATGDVLLKGVALSRLE